MPGHCLPDTNRPIRLLFATDHIHYPQGGGGGERNAHELCLALRAAGAQPAVMCRLSPNDTMLSWSNRIRRKLPPQHQFPCDQICGYPVYRGWAENGAAEIVSRFRPDLVIVQSARPRKIVLQFVAHDVPVMIYLHEVAQIDHLAIADQLEIPVLANSPFTANRAGQSGFPSHIVLPLVEPAFYRAETSGRKVLFVNTVPRKGLETAFRLAETRPDIPFDFVLSWILTEDQIAQLRIRARRSGNIKLHSPVQDMRPLYAQARIVLVPSLVEETWGRVVTEAHINGIPVIASGQGGLPASVGPGGLIVAADAPIEEWREAVSRLWDDQETYASVAKKALDWSRRPEIQPASIVSKLLTVVQAEIAAHNRKTLRTEYWPHGGPGSVAHHHVSSVDQAFH